MNNHQQMTHQSTKIIDASCASAADSSFSDLFSDIEPLDLNHFSKDMIDDETFNREKKRHLPNHDYWELVQVQEIFNPASNRSFQLNGSVLRKQQEVGFKHSILE
ncbi:hypothetical protein IV203_007696 [Nitzschia inconspicua]|uniref:Uncharacterized protein n=1 Tax=Nitzschia inconspicua TaxID=303405 RepID=A0A9K3KYS0_9STRA|nr:hypothetical protein IV203_007696 [Nitzschia inconspicua]